MAPFFKEPKIKCKPGVFTKEEVEWFEFLDTLPCSVNNKDCSWGVEKHHITKGGRRIGHLFTIPLCFNHHQSQTPLPYGEAVHKGREEFEAKHGTQMKMLKQTQELYNG